MPAPLILIDEGFIALSDRYFAAALEFLNTLPVTTAVVIATNERIGEIRRRLNFPLADWQMESGRLLRQGVLQPFIFNTL